MERLILEHPAPLVLGVVVLGVVAGFLQRSSRPARFLPILAGTFILAAGLAMLARLVVTPREQVVSASARLVEAVRDADLGAVDALLSDQAELIADSSIAGVGLIFPSRLDKREILAQVREHLAGDARVSHARVTESRPRLTGPGIAQIDLHVQLVFQNYGPHQSWWRLDWRRDESGWRCWTIEPRGEH